MFHIKVPYSKADFTWKWQKIGHLSWDAAVLWLTVAGMRIQEAFRSTDMHHSFFSALFTTAILTSPVPTTILCLLPGQQAASSPADVIWLGIHKTQPQKEVIILANIAIRQKVLVMP